MKALIIGHPDSGKSAVAEDMVLGISAPGERIYLATMIPYGDEGTERVRRHREMRAGKGFETIEAPFDAAEALTDVKDPENRTVLLECLSNLAANELFERNNAPDAVIHKLTDDIIMLAEKVKNLIIVSNHFEITPDFDKETVLYANTLDSINLALSDVCDEVIRID